MFTILSKKTLTSDTFLMEVKAPRIAKSAQPGQFVIVISDEKGERIPLTICGYNPIKETITLVIKAIEIGRASCRERV